MALTDKLTAIANAIRAKTGQSGALTLSQMAAAISNIPTGSVNSRVWIFQNENDTSKSGTVSILSSDEFLKSHKNDPSLTITLYPLSTITANNLYIYACIHTNRQLTTSNSGYGRTICSQISSTSLGDNSPTAPLSSSTTSCFIINGDTGALSFRAADGGSGRILPAATWVITATISGT